MVCMEGMEEEGEIELLHGWHTIGLAMRRMCVTHREKELKCK